MKLYIFLFLGLYIISCKKEAANTEQDSKYTFDLAATYNAFNKQIKESINQWNKDNNDSLSGKILLDSTFIFSVDNSELMVVLSQYHTADNRITYGIVSIENFKGEGLPTFLLTDPTAEKYLGDSVKLANGQLLIYCRILRKAESENLKISFDLDFDGTKFPWDTE